MKLLKTQIELWKINKSLRKHWGAVGTWRQVQQPLWLAS